VCGGRTEHGSGSATECVSRDTVAKRWTRFLRDPHDAVTDEPGLDVPRTITDAQAEEVVVRTREETPVWNTLVDAPTGQSRGDLAGECAEGLACLRPAAVTDRDVQDLTGPVPYRQDP
jgi:hypothetical protein